jgi:pilus assembly protein CpaE
MDSGAAQVGTRGLAAFIDDPEWRQTVEAALAPNWPDAICGRGGLAAALSAMADDDAPSIMLVDLAGTEDAVAGIHALAKICGDATRIIALGAVNDVSFYRRLIDAGAKDYLVRPIQPDMLAAAIDSVHAPHPVGASNKSGARFAAVIGARGGAGATMVAINTAWTIAHHMDKSVALVDLDLSFGTVALALDLEPTHGLREILDNPERIDNLFIKSALVRESENLSVLGAEEPFDDHFTVNSTALERLLSELTDTVDLVVADVPRNMVGAQRELFARADTVVIVSELTLASIRDTMRLATFIREAAEDVELIVVANKSDSGRKGEISKAEFERGIKMSVNHMLPWNPKVAAKAANAGKPLAEVAARSDIVRAVMVLSQAVSGDGVIESSSGGLSEGILDWLNANLGEDLRKFLRLPISRLRVPS